MALIDVRCVTETCGKVFEHYRPASEWPKTPPCETCGGPTEQAHFPKAVNWTMDPIVVYRAPDGSFRFPGDAHDAGAGKYDRLGYERMELRSAADVRRFESQATAHDSSLAQRRFEQQQAQREAREKTNRSELYRQMPSMTRFGRELARTAIARNDGKPLKRAHAGGVVSEVMSYDRSNREESRGSDGRRRRD
jgi:hypothetical protein